jgi:hypothetical protein
MKPFHILPCENIDAIGNDVMHFLEHGTDVLQRSANKDFSWNFFSAKALLIAVPEINVWFRSNNLLLRDVAATVTRSTNGLAPHKDEPPVVAKVNFPILNTYDTWNVWWDDEGNEVARIQMDQPVVFNATLTHAVEIGESAELPRIVLSCMFFKEPEHLSN